MANKVIIILIHMESIYLKTDESKQLILRTFTQDTSKKYDHKQYELK